MAELKKLATVRRFVCWAAVFCASTMITSPARGAFHLWSLQELYSNASGTLQFIELVDQGVGGQEFVQNTTISVTNVGGTMTHMFTFPTNLPGNSFEKTFIIGTSGIQAAGGPVPDFVVPNGFLFTGGGSISYFQASGPYTALPLDGLMCRDFPSGTNNATNSPVNFAGQTGVVNGVPEPTALVLTSIGAGIFGVYRRLSPRKQVKDDI